MIPNALYILFCPLYTFRDKLDMFAVRVTHNSACADADTVCNEYTVYNCAFFYNCTRHQYTVDNFGIRANLYAGKEYGVFNLTFNYYLFVASNNKSKSDLYNLSCLILYF